MDIFGMGTRHGLSAFEQVAVVAVVITAFISLLYAWLLRGSVLKKDKGTPKMQEVWNAIRIGADSYLNTQLKRILPIIIILSCPLLKCLHCSSQYGSKRRVPHKHDIDHRDRPYSCVYHGSSFLSDGWPIRNAHGNSGQCTGCLCRQERVQ